MSGCPWRTKTILECLYVVDSFKAAPAWVSIFDEVDGFPVDEMKTVGSKAIYAINVENRWFCFTFGHARHLIDDDAVERNFGLVVALNLGDPEAIKAIDKASIEWDSKYVS